MDGILSIVMINLSLNSFSTFFATSHANSDMAVFRGRVVDGQKRYTTP